MAVAGGLLMMVLAGIIQCFCESELICRRYAAGDVYAFDTKQTKNPDSFDNGDVVGVLIDRDNGLQYVSFSV